MKKFKEGEFILIPIDGYYQIKIISNKIKDKNSITWNEVIKSNEKIYRWEPTINEKCIFIDEDKEFIDIFVGLDEGFINDYSYKSKNEYEIENPCPCCFEKEPILKINKFDYCEPYIGQKISYLNLLNK